MTESAKIISNTTKHNGFLYSRFFPGSEMQPYFSGSGIHSCGIAAIRAPYEMLRAGGTETRHWTLWLIREGTVEFEIPGKRFIAEPGSALLMSSDTDRRCVVKKGVFRHVHFLLSPSPGWEQGVFPSVYAEEIEALLNLLFRCRIEGAEPEMMRHTAALLNDCLRRELGGPFRSGRIRRLVELVEAAPERRWTAGMLARALNISESLLFQLCRSQCGRSPGELVAEIRFRYASELLLRTGEKLEGIAARTGYSSAFAFSKAFRKFTGVSPKEFRRREKADRAAL